MGLLKRAEKDGRRFLNPVPAAVGGFSIALKVLPHYLSNKEETEPRIPLGPFHTDAALYAEAPASGLRVTWFGHSSLLVEIDGVRVLIDPIWEQRASPMQWFGPKRFFAPTLALEDLPPVDVVLISHDHYDHFGAQTLRRLATLNPKIRWVTSLGVGERLRRLGVEAGQIQELDWTQSAEVSGQAAGVSLKITAWPSKHFSGRGLFDRFTTLWSSFVLEGPKHRVYFGADSGWWEGFAEIAAQYDGFDLTMLEIGAFSPLWSDIHMGPDGAARAYQDLGGPEKAGLLMPIHWGLFNLALHGWRQPMERMMEVAQSEGLPLWSPQPGVPSEVTSGDRLFSAWWHHK
ncbi:MBL fold metallo-hydrolase [Granulicella mallensis]|uniref:Beta-lactamase domain protein n=1 Tax=Granulicella mallensis (strain ATCC BAA-1857 / DSM 23137 / MP5ACTX8) TaxID=682795 RepID=G8P037_GRAMM|nr:MBL fold metallo-hydrolase [Granulicella mallensis]AEU35753.1 beta-lactamase domain protein [Granulicella mallensis MP5ACTX8]